MGYLSERPYACRCFEIGYGLDGGGYEVESAPEWGANVVRWEDPSHDYFPFYDYGDSRGGDTVLIASVNDVYGWQEFPSIVRESADSALVLVTRGENLGSDHDCWACTPAWEYEDQEDQRSTCERCEATGLVDSPCTRWALYRRVDVDYSRTDYGVPLPLETGVDPE